MTGVGDSAIRGPVEMPNEGNPRRFTNASAMSRLLHDNGLIGYVQTPSDMPDGAVKIVAQDRACAAHVRVLLKASGYVTQYATGFRTVRVIGRRKV
ncbi:MAG: hypothetical protein E6R04_08645 [Spirochaetes bacterium]|nr:MAG: hypothetical protein E6R04_08645 [Spirochaetota bacterium]